MKLIHAVLLACSMALTFPVMASDQWVEVAASENGGVFSVQRGSLRITKTQSGIDIVIVTGRQYSVKKDKITLHRWYVTKSDCRRKQGTLAIVGLNTGEVTGSADFAEGAENVSTGIATFLCLYFEPKADGV